MASARDAWVALQLERAVLVSDAFFPFPDSIDVAALAGIRTIYQPGGSLRDAEVIARCDDLGVAMATLGRRHFKH
jgi:phosphoribosylaminoimidazolecarboxamide formyltransferase/IMP cyclohydrolase